MVGYLKATKKGVGTGVVVGCVFLQRNRGYTSLNNLRLHLYINSLTPVNPQNPSKIDFAIELIKRLRVINVRTRSRIPNNYAYAISVGYKCYKWLQTFVTNTATVARDYNKTASETLGYKCYTISYRPCIFFLYSPMEPDIIFILYISCNICNI